MCLIQWLANVLSFIENCRLLLLTTRLASLYDVNANENHCEYPKTLAQVILLTVADLSTKQNIY
jgi:hypothetical protein